MEKLFEYEGTSDWSKPDVVFNEICFKKILIQDLRCLFEKRNNSVQYMLLLCSRYVNVSWENLHSSQNGLNLQKLYRKL